MPSSTMARFRSLVMLLSTRASAPTT
jgi:hypothetical protein